MKKFLKKTCALLTLTAMVTSGSAHANDCYNDAGGCGYQECRRAPCIAPCIALGAIALAAIIAIAIQNSSCDHGHCS